MYRGFSIYGDKSLSLESPEIIGGPDADHDVLQKKIPMTTRGNIKFRAETFTIIASIYFLNDV